ncbi:SLC13 family permease [Metabacillus arenae]|uniref:Sodium-dependent dicarboxylate transporter SdcS n=1 Tax=Metabacillus arenae TaxID=2771434 RepID=A0A926NFX2_9BACI|nr:SLC13 family permease [Metabacillus arenae]MBD1383557.1 anion permease [Metabacillus arenae]
MNVEWSRQEKRKVEQKDSKLQFFSWIASNKGRYYILSAFFLFLLIFPSELAIDGRLSLITFIAATYCWAATSLPPSFVAIGSILVLTVTGAASQEMLYSSLSSDVIWLMIGAFIVGAAMQTTGLAGRATFFLTSKANSIKGLFFLLAFIIQLLTLFIPSTSGRASVLLPIFRNLSKEINNEKVITGLSLLIPTIILIATSSTLIGASSHLVANDYLQSLGFEKITFLKWMLWGIPFTFVASLSSCAVILKLFLDKEARKISLKEMFRKSQVNNEFSVKEKMTLIVLGLMVLLWTTEHVHGLDIATVTVIGAFLLVLPGIGTMSWKDGLQAVSWNLILFVGAAITLGEALIDSGAAEWIIDFILAFTKGFLFNSEFVTLLLLTVISLSSHLYITSHTMRAVILAPPLLSLALAENLNVVSIVFLLMVGMNYCLTFPVSSKALLIYFDEKRSFQAQDLRNLSKVLSVVYLLIIIVFYYTYWRWTGLTL